MRETSGEEIREDEPCSLGGLEVRSCRSGGQTGALTNPCQSAIVLQRRGPDHLSSTHNGNRIIAEFGKADAGRRQRGDAQVGERFYGIEPLAAFRAFGLEEKFRYPAVAPLAVDPRLFCRFVTFVRSCSCL